MRFLYDESHNQTWTIDPACAVQLSRRTNEAPRYYSYAHVAELARTLLGAAVERVTAGPLTRQRLAGADLLLINHCCLSKHKHLGVGGEAIFGLDEIAAIRAAVEDGMGLLVLGEFEIDSWGSNVNAVLRPFGMRFNHDVATVCAQGVRGPLQLPVFETTGIVRHPATAAVRKISYGAGCTLTLLDRRASAIVTAGGPALLAAAEIGRGRVVAAGDSDLFAEPYVSYNDNRALLVGLLSWLSGKRAAAPAVSPAREETAHELVAQGLAQSAGPVAGTVVDLDEETRERACQLLAGMKLDPHGDFEAFAFEAKLVFHELPQRLRRALVEFAHRGNIDGALLLRGLPQDPEIPPTPSRSGERAHKPTHASELWLCAIAAALGEPVGYLPEKQGSIFQDIFPTPANADKLSSESSSILLDFHTEIAFHPFMPDYILLYGLRQDPERAARTIVASVRRFFHLLEPADKDTLFSNLFRTGIDYSFGNTGQQRGAGPMVSVLYGDRLDPYLRYDLDLMVGQTPAARHALEVVRELVHDVRREVAIEPGSLLVIDNRRAVHARSTFKACYDGRDRWLQRVAVVRDLEASLHDRMRGTRVIATDFSSYLGARAADSDAG
jgi:Taurine catabolism dioxygenase TauD, TfdA family